MYGPFFPFFLLQVSHFQPKSFATSVENLFHFAFLIHDGVASLREDKQGELYCNLAEKPQTQNVNSTEVRTQQRAISLTPQLWEVRNWFLDSSCVHLLTS
jgi:hypothetical protein